MARALGLRARTAAAFLLSRTKAFSENWVMNRSPFFSRRCPRARARVRPQVDPLESRDVPSNFTPGPLVQVSGPSPFNGCPYQPAYARNAETENFVAVDPS